MSLDFKLKQLASIKPYRIEEAVCKAALNYEYGSELFFHDIYHYSSLSGIVPGLDSVEAGERFFDRYFHQIDRIRGKYEREFSNPVPISGEFCLHFACFAFDYIALEIIDVFKIDVVLPYFDCVEYCR